MAVIRLPGLVDVHTHLRVPGGEHKEDFATGTAAALAGGFTTILAMPNTSPPLSTPAALQGARRTAAASIRCDVGLFAGASPADIASLAECAPFAVGLKIYLNDTFGPLRVEELPVLQRCFRDWPRGKVIAMHAEGQSVAAGIGLAAAHNRPVHFCHISRRDEVELIAAAKGQGVPVTCEVTPHHLFLTEGDAARLGPLGDMRPRLATQADVDALWEHISGTIDCIATDHAPHTLAEKYGAGWSGATTRPAGPPPPGVPGLETSLPLMLAAAGAGRLTLDRLIELMGSNPRRIFGLAEPADTFVEVVDEAVVFSEEGLQTRCGWTPFAGMAGRGRVRRVVLRGETVYQAGEPPFLAAPGRGRLLPEGSE
jgi:carbamoyl-phosphate synthase/aspartate carbamoyltransferase/dihydroorotase